MKNAKINQSKTKAHKSNLTRQEMNRKLRKALLERVGVLELGILALVASLITLGAVALMGEIGGAIAIAFFGNAVVLGLVFLLYRVQRTSSSARQQTVGVGLPVDGSTADYKALLQKVDIFSHLNGEQIDSIASLGLVVRVPEGQRFIPAGKDGEHIFVVIRGTAQLFANSNLGEITIRTVGPGESFPLSGLIGEGALLTSAEALTDMDLLAIPSSSILEMCSRDTDVGARIYKSVAETLGSHYSSTLKHLTERSEKVLQETGFFRNV